MLVPSITFINESNGSTPVRSGIRNRIGIIGEFSRGPANVPRYVAGFTDFANTYGSDITKGSLGFQGAWDQGARDFMLLRVLGNSTASSGSITVSGVASAANTLYLNFKYIGRVNDLNPLVALNTPIITSGINTGNASGSYYLFVSEVNLGIATIKYVFVPKGGTPPTTAADWTAIATELFVDLVADKGVPKPLQNGVLLTFSDTTTNINLAVNNKFAFLVNSYSFPIEINQYELPNQIVSSIQEKIVGVSPIGDTEITPSSVIFKADQSLLPGALGNRMFYYVTLQNPDAQLSFTNTGSTNAAALTGGVAGPRVAARDFFSFNGSALLRLQALNEGDWGNQLKVSIYPISNKEFRLTISDGNGALFNPSLNDESYTVNFNNTTSNGELLDLVNSKFIRGFFLPKALNPNGFDSSLINASPLRLAPANAAVTDTQDERHPSFYGPSKLINIPLEEGYDGPPITDNDYVAALKQFESQPVHILFTPGKYESSSIKSALISHAENSSVEDGRRVVVLSTKPNLNPNAAKQESIGLVSDSAALITGWCTYGGQPNAPRFGMSPDCLYAGKLAAIGHWVQPHAVTTAGPINNILETDNLIYNGKSSLQVYTDARLEVIRLDKATSGFFFTNGRTLSEGLFLKMSTRRTFDVLQMDINDILQSYRSEPHNFRLRRQIVTGLNSYFASKLSQGHIANYQTPICDSSNNPASSYDSGQLYVNASFLDLAAADYIYITLTRDNGSGLAQFGV